MLNLTRFARRAMRNSISKSRSNPRSSKNTSASRNISSSASSGSSKQVSGPPKWLWATAVVSAAGVGGWSWSSFLGGSKKRQDEVDTAKQNYLTCIGDDVSLPLPDEECVITFVPDVPPPITRDYPVRLRLDMDTSLRQVPLDGSKLYEIWSFNGGAPGPFIRAREGDVLDISFTNKDTSGMWHNIDFHAISGPGGGAGVLTAEKNETRSGQFKLMYPGLYIYHCAVHPVAHHIANGMYGLILVEPAEGLPPVDKEFCVVQSEFYTNDEPEEKGSNLLGMNEERLVDENPNYVVFNGRVNSMTTSDGGSPLVATAGERVRIFFGNAGPNLVSSFHVIGAIFDKVYREGDLMTPPARGLQTTLVPAGGAAVVEFVPTTPGNLTLVDHSISRIDKGAVGFLTVEGPVCPNVFHSDKEARPCKPCKIHP